MKLKDLKDTQKHASKIADHVSQPSLILLKGDLGVGKTQWVRFFIQSYFKNNKLNIQSPSYSLVQVYEKEKKKIVHMDLYRISDLNDLESTGFWDFMGEKNIICVEWSGLLPKEHIKGRECYEIEMKFLENNQRELTCFRNGTSYP